ncbi:MAG: type II secretion system F family protein [Candidatus Omnitrophota bacterium]
MPLYHYRALTNEGQLVSGAIAAVTRVEAVSQIKERGMRPVNVDEESAKVQTAPTVASIEKRSRITSRDIQVFTSQLAALLHAGIVMSNALSILEEQTESGSLSQIIHDVREDIHGGASLSESLSRYPKQFNKLYCSMVRVGESGGVLDVVLKQLSGFMEAENVLRSNILTALAYPMLVVLVGIGSITVLVTFVIPRLSGVFADFGDNLPWLTRTLIRFSDGVLKYWWVFFLALAGVVYMIRRMLQSEAGREKLDRFKDRIPALGTVFIKAQIARFSRTMGTLVKSGIPVLNALNLVVDTTTSAILSHSLRNVCEKVKKGEGLAKPLRETGFFPPMVTNLIAVGEESGSLDEMLFQVADAYDVEVQHSIKRFITLFEPMVIILMAIGVGGILFAFLLPIMKIGNMMG